MSPPLFAGVARADITPPVGIAHGNWGAAVHERAEGIDMPLRATALVFFQGGVHAAIVDLDLLKLSEDTVDAMRRRITELAGIPGNCVRISCSHTHSGPTTSTATWKRQGVEMVPVYQAELVEKVARAVHEAAMSLQPVHLTAGRGTCEVNVNRRYKLPGGRIIVGQNPEGFVDHDVTVVRVNTLAGAPLATVVHYACHPTIMAHTNRKITPDYPGPLRRVVEAAVGGQCLFLQGAAGNVASIEDLANDPVAYRRIGAIIGHEAAKVALSLETPPGRPELEAVIESGATLGIFRRRREAAAAPKLVVIEETVVLPGAQTRPATEIEAELRDQTKKVERLRKESAPERELLEAIYKARRLSLEYGKVRNIGPDGYVRVPVHLVCIGDIAVLGAPVEIFAEIGAELKRRSPFAVTLVSGYTNGAMGYLPTESAHREGGYEVGASPFAPKADAVFVEGCLRLLRRAHDRVAGN